MKKALQKTVLSKTNTHPTVMSVAKKPIDEDRMGVNDSRGGAFVPGSEGMKPPLHPRYASSSSSWVRVNDKKRFLSPSKSNTLPPCSPSSSLGWKRITKRKRLESGEENEEEVWCRQEKIVTDPVHGTIELSGCLWAVVDTPEFQRLRGLKQLGASDFVYPGAHHTRFEHSLGVAHLATVLTKSLRARQPELAITDVDIICVGLAGLCHDLGHGPFSHLFDEEFLRGANKEWTHEKGSVLMLRHLLAANNIRLQDYGLCGIDVTFVEEMILGSQIEGGMENRKGRGPEKAFLYEIINNERSGFDVDKLDYIHRDSYYTGVQVKLGADFDRLFLMARVRRDESGIRTICFPEKAVGVLFCVFHCRVLLHSFVYQHPVVKACELMVRDILHIANPYLLFGEKGDYTMSAAVQDMSVFAQLKDSVLDLIEMSSHPRLAPAKVLLQRLKRRELYRCCGKAELPYTLSKEGKTAKEDEISRQILQIAREERLGSNSSVVTFSANSGGLSPITPTGNVSLETCEISADDFIVEVMFVHHGQGWSNPVDSLRFYSKADPVNCFKIGMEKYGGAILPKSFAAPSVRVFSKHEEKRELIARCFVKWTRRQRMASPLCHNSQQQPPHGDDNDEEDDDGKILETEYEEEEDEDGIEQIFSHGS